MDKFLSIQAFVHVAESRSFSEAARRLRVAASVVTHRVQQLEAHVQLSLFHRSTRTVVPSEAGARFLEECTDMVSQIDSVIERMRMVKGTPAGILRLQVLPGFALGHLGSALRDFNTLYPHIELDITVSDLPANPTDKGFDVVLQIFRTRAETNIERTLFPVHRVFCASPEYLARHPVPLEPEDLLKHRLGIYSAYPTRDRWTFKEKSSDKDVNLQLPAAIRSNSVHMLRDFAIAHGGITCLPTLVCANDLIDGQLINVLDKYEIPPLELVAIYPVTHRRALKVTLFIDFIAKRFTGMPAWDKAILNHQKSQSTLGKKKPK